MTALMKNVRLAAKRIGELAKSPTRRFVTASCVALLTTAAPASADVTATDLQVAARALSFMEKPLNGTVRVGILHSPDNARSLAQARAVRDLLGSGMRVGNVELRPVLVASADVVRIAVDLVFLTESATAADAHAAKAAMRNRVPCVTTDIEQVSAGACLMGVQSRPKVSIIVNRAAADASGVKFATVFRVMITEL